MRALTASLVSIGTVGEFIPPRIAQRPASATKRSTLEIPEAAAAIYTVTVVPSNLVREKPWKFSL